MGFLKKFFSKIFDWLHRVVKAADKAIEEASPEVLKALEIGSKILNTINNSFELAPAAITDLLKKVLPNLTEDEIRKALQVAAKGLNIGNDIADSTNLENLIDAVQKNLSGLKVYSGSDWAQKSAFVAKLIAKAFSPDTKVSVFELLMETYYQTRVKDLPIAA